MNLKHEEANGWNATMNVVGRTIRTIIFFSLQCIANARTVNNISIKFYSKLIQIHKWTRNHIKVRFKKYKFWVPGRSFDAAGRQPTT